MSLDSTIYQAEMSEHLGDIAFDAQKYDEAIEQYSQAISSRLQSTPSQLTSSAMGA